MRSSAPHFVFQYDKTCVKTRVVFNFRGGDLTQFRIRPPQAHDWPVLRQLFLESRIAVFHCADIRRF